MLFNLSSMPGLAAGVAAAGFAARGCVLAPAGAGVLAGGFALALPAAAGLPNPGNGVVPFTILSASKSGTASLSFFTRIETLRFDGSVGLFFTRSIWSAYP